MTWLEFADAIKLKLVTKCFFTWRAKINPHIRISRLNTHSFVTVRAIFYSPVLLFKSIVNLFNSTWNENKIMHPGKYFLNKTNFINWQTVGVVDHKIFPNNLLVFNGELECISIGETTDLFYKLNNEGDKIRLSFSKKDIEFFINRLTGQTRVVEIEE